MSEKKNVDVIQLWKLPNNFFQLETIEDQFDVIKSITVKAPKTTGVRSRTSISLYDDFLAASFFLITLGLPMLLAFCYTVCIVSYIRGQADYLSYLGYLIAINLVLSLHPKPRDLRHTRLALAIIRYFTYEIVIDRDDPLTKDMGTIDVFNPNTKCQYKHNPIVCLACPHGIFNYGAIIWCCISKWIIGREQYTGAASVVQYVPGLRYMNCLIWAIDVDRRSIKKCLQKPYSSDKSGLKNEKERSKMRGAGMLGMVPDGILGAFRCKVGVDELIIGKRRGLMRICAEEGATVYGAWFFGTTDMLTVVQDPFGIMETISRKLQAGMMFFYGRFFLPIPRRVPVTLVCKPYECEKNAAPTKEQVEDIHQNVYGGLLKVYEDLKIYSGYPDRKLKIT